MYKLLRSSLVLVLLLGTTSSVFAQQVVPASTRLISQSSTPPHWIKAFTPAGADLITGLSVELSGKNIAERAMTFTREFREIILPGDSFSEIKTQRILRTPLSRVVHMKQYIEGIPVMDSSLILSFDPGGRLTTVIQRTTPIESLPDTKPLVSEKTAIEMASRALGGPLRSSARIKTVWIRSRQGLVKARLVTLPSANPVGDFTYVIAGKPARVLWRYARTPMAMGYAHKANPIRDETYEQVELPYLTSDEHLAGDNVEVWNCTGSDEGTCSVKQHLALPDENGDYFIEPTGDDDPDLDSDRFVEVQAYYGINTIHDYFLGIGATPTPLQAGVNYPMPDNYGPNAFFSPQENAFGGGPGIMMGQWRDIDLALDNDVIFHEYGHHVFGQYSQAGMFEMDDYGPVFWGLAFNEATADYFSCSALDDPSLGEYFASRIPAFAARGYLRMLDNDLTCPDGLYGEGHDDGMVWSGFVWKVRQLFGAEVVDPLYLDVISHFPSSMDFPTATSVFLDRAAQVLDESQLQQVRDLAEARGIVECERFLTITRSGHTGFCYGKQIMGQYGNMLDFIPAELHYTLELPQDADSLEIHISSPAMQGGDMVLLVRQDTPVEHSFSYLTGLQSTYDFMLEDDGVFDLTDANSQFVPGHTYYFHPVNRGQGTTEYTINGGFTTAESDGGIDEDGGTQADGGIEQDGGTNSDSDQANTDSDQMCPDGQQVVMVNGEKKCAPICKDGYELKLEGEQWTCIQSADGCSCTTKSPTGNMLALLMSLFVFAAWRRNS